MRILAASALVLTLAAPQAAVAAQETETIDRTVSIGPNGTLKLKGMYFGGVARF